MIKLKINSKDLDRINKRLVKFSDKEAQRIISSAGRAAASPYRKTMKGLIAGSPKGVDTGLLHDSIILKARRYRKVIHWFGIGAESKVRIVTRTVTTGWRMASRIASRANVTSRTRLSDGRVEITYQERANPAKYFHLLDQGTQRITAQNWASRTKQSNDPRAMDRFWPKFEKAMLRVMARRIGKK